MKTLMLNRQGFSIGCGPLYEDFNKYGVWFGCRSDDVPLPGLSRWQTYVEFSWFIYKDKFLPVFSFSFWNDQPKE